MLKQLLKKQMLEMFQNFFVDKKKNKGRSKASTASFIVFYLVLIVGVVGGMFTYLSISLCKPLVSQNLGWLYFTFMSLVAVAMGVFGSVFNTYSGLYLAKDNDLLLSMPIPVKYVMVSRLLSVYIMGFIYSAVVIIPAVVVYFLNAAVTVTSAVGCVLLVLITSALVMFLSCLLGWVVAKISSKLKNKSFITVIISLAFFAAYYFVYFKANEIIKLVIANAAVYGAKIKGSAYPLYVFGSIGTGNLLSALIVIVITAALLAVTYYIIEKSFIGIATASEKRSKTVYKEKREKSKSVDAALVAKEIRRFVANPNYILNCGFGSILLPIAAVFLLVKHGFVGDLSANIFGDDSLTAAFTGFLVCLLTTMNDISAPSVSLEGKNIWLMQALPITPWQVLRAKLRFHFLLTAVPAVICAVCASVSGELSVLSTLLVIAVAFAFIALFDCLGLAVNLKSPNLTWTNEITPIKQSASVMVCLFGGWIYSAALMALGFGLGRAFGSDVFLAAATALTAAIAFAIYSWLKKKGTRIFAEL